jgi:hypothetical protein
MNDSERLKLNCDLQIALANAARRTAKANRNGAEAAVEKLALHLLKASYLVEWWAEQLPPRNCSEALRVVAHYRKIALKHLPTPIIETSLERSSDDDLDPPFDA